MPSVCARSLEEEEAVAGIREGEGLNPGQFRHEGEARVDLERHGSPRQAGKIDMTPVDFIVNECVNEEEAL